MHIVIDAGDEIRVRTTSQAFCQLVIDGRIANRRAPTDASGVTEMVFSGDHTRNAYFGSRDVIHGVIWANKVRHELTVRRGR